jgi:heptosyltransferase-2
LVLHRIPSLETHHLKLTLGINPGASYGSAKRWYPQEFAKVASELASQYDIVIFGGPGERDIAQDIENLLIDKSVTNYQNLVGRTTISELINRISGLDLFITGDSGPMHVAAAFQVPTVAIFGPTKDNETSQWMNEKSIIVKQSLSCQPCMKRTCPLGHHDCMNLIKAVDVLSVINNF